jgi:MFS family permease
MPKGPSIRQQLLSCFQHGPFARYMAGEAVSMTGSWMQVMAQGWVMTTLTSSAVMLGLVNFATGLPMLILALKGGVLADKLNKRHILILAQILQIASALSIGWLVHTQQIQIWHIITIATLLGIVFAFEMPAVNALVPELVHPHQISTAIAIDRSVFHGTRLLGPAIAGYVVARWGEATAFYLNALSFLALIAALLSFRSPPKQKPSHPAQNQEGIAAGLRYVRSDHPTVSMLGLRTLSTLFVFPVLVVMMPLYARHLLQLDPTHMGWLMGLTAFGSLTGALGLLAIPSHHRCAVFLTMVLGVGAGLAGLSLAPSFAWAAPSLILLALCVSSIVGLAHTIIQERAPSQMRGRVSAIAGLSFFGIMPFASLGITYLADLITMRTTLALSAAAYTLLALPIVLGPSRRLWEQSPRTEPPAPRTPPQQPEEDPIPPHGFA